MRAFASPSRARVVVARAARRRAIDAPFAAFPAGASLNVLIAASRRGVELCRARSRRGAARRDARAAPRRAMAGAAGVDNTQRRKWDRDAYAKRAAERELAEKESEKNGGRPAPPARGAAGAIVMREDLRVDKIIQRDYKRDIESRVGTKSIVNLETGAGMGFQCKETGVVLHDSAAYLDHINGKKQMKARGMSMRVERSTVDQVRAKFEAVKKRKAEEKANGGKAKAYEERLAIAEADEETMRARKKAKEQARKAKKRAEEEAALNELSAGVDPEMAAMMGFSGFGGGK